MSETIPSAKDAIFKTAFMRSDKTKQIKVAIVAQAVDSVRKILADLLRKGAPPTELATVMSSQDGWSYVKELDALLLILNNTKSQGALTNNEQAIAKCTKVWQVLAALEEKVQAADQRQLEKEKADRGQDRADRRQRKDDEKKLELKEKDDEKAAEDKKRQTNLNLMGAGFDNTTVILFGENTVASKVPMGKTVCIPFLNGNPQPKFAGVSQDNDFGCDKQGNWSFRNTKNKFLNSLGNELCNNHGVQRNSDGTIRSQFVCSEVDAALRIASAGQNWSKYQFLCVNRRDTGWEYIARCTNCQSTFEEP